MLRQGPRAADVEGGHARGQLRASGGHGGAGKGVLCVVLQIFVQYTRYVLVLKWLTLSLFAYFGTVMVVDIPWGEVARGLFIPTLSASMAFWTSVVAILGTTISPYLFFWQASQEVEDVEAKPERDPLKYAPHQAESALARIRLDTYIGMAFSNLVAIAIIVTTAATLHVHGITNIQTSSEAAEALRPLAGRFAFSVFTLGILGTGLLAVPVLAGSAAYAIGEARKWPTGLARQPLQAKAFLCDLSDRHFGWGCIEFYLVRSDPGAILVRGHQRCSCGAGDGPDDASYRQYKGHGPIYGDWRPALYGMAGDRRHDRRGRWNAHYCSHVAGVAQTWSPIPRC
jgi:hypothetical protein